MAKLRVDNCLYKALGLSDREVNLPRFIVVNSWSEVSPGHFHLDKVAQAVKNGIYAAGGLPLELNVPDFVPLFRRAMKTVFAMICLNVMLLLPPLKRRLNLPPGKRRALY